MKLRTIVGMLSLSLTGLWGCEESAEQPAEQPAEEGQAAAPEAQPAPEETAPELTPQEVCTQAVEAAKADDEAKLTALVSGDLTQGTAKSHLVAGLSGGTCGEGKVDGEKATVPVTAGAGKKATTKEVPLVKAEDGWKIDLAAYQAAYPEKAKRGKKGKRAKGKRAKS